MIRRLPFLLLVCAMGCGLLAKPQPNTAPTTDPELDWKVEPFSLTERSGKTVTDKDLHGSVWVASFIFTRCIGPCPAVTSSVATLQKEFKDEPGLKFVTFTVDPQRDDLRTLNDYAKSRGADPDRWLFLTGDETTIHKLLRGTFKQAVGRKEGEDVKPGDEFSHSTRLMVVDRNGVIRGIYAGMPDERIPDSQADFDANINRLKTRVRSLLK